MSNKISSWIQYCASPRQTQDTGYKTGKVVSAGSRTLLLDEGAVLPGQKLDLRTGGRGGQGLKGLQKKRYEESALLPGDVHGVKGGDVGWSHSYGTSTGAGTIMDGMARSWRGEDTWRKGGGLREQSLTHGRTHIRCSWSRSCHRSAHGRRRRFLWSCRPPCGNLHRPACQRPAPGR